MPVIDSVTTQYQTWRVAVSVSQVELQISHKLSVTLSYGMTVNNQPALFNLHTNNTTLHFQIV